MTDVGTIVAGYGITIVTVVMYGVWILMRGRALGDELGIGHGADADSAASPLASEAEGTNPWT